MDNKVKEISDRIDNITQILKKTSISKKSEKEKLFFKKILTIAFVFFRKFIYSYFYCLKVY